MKQSKNIVVYPVLIKHEDDGYFVTIPDIKNGFTEGDTEKEAILMAKDAIGNLLQEIKVEDYPKASNISDIKVGKDEKLVFVDVDMDEFNLKYPILSKTNVTFHQT